MTIQKSKQGFTLTELLVTMGVLAILIALSAPAFRTFQNESDLQNATEEIRDVLQLAQSRTLASENESQYGVYFTTGVSPHQYIFFQGSGYASRDPAQDQVFTLPSSVEFVSFDFEVSGGQEVVFNRLTGTTGDAGNMVLRLRDDASRTQTLYVESLGNVELDSSVAASDADRDKDTRHVHIDYDSIARPINTATESIRLDFSPSAVTKDIPIAGYMNGGQIAWGGTIDVGGELQTLDIRTHQLNHAALGTQFSIRRDLRFNTKHLTITLSGDSTGKLIEYKGIADGANGELVPGGESLYVTATTPQ